MRLLFIHPTLRNYRIELFNKLHINFNIKFIFLAQKKGGIDIPYYWDYKNFDVEKGINSLTTLKNWLDFYFFLMKEEYDIIITSPAESFNSIILLLIAKIKQKKIVFWGETWYFPLNKFLKILNFKLKLFFLKRGNAILGSGEKSSEFYKKYTDKKLVYNAPNYVPPKKIIDRSTIYNLKLIDEKILKNKIILYLGQIKERKGLDYLIKSFKLLESKLPDICLLVVGDGSFRKECEELANTLKVKNIVFTGFALDEKIDIYYNICDVFVLPTIIHKDYAEPIGLVVCEALSIGKPVIVTTAVGASQYIKDGVNGFIVKEKNIEELFLALYKILSNDTLRTKMSMKSKEIYNEKINLNKQYTAFKEVIDNISK